MRKLLLIACACFIPVFLIAQDECAFQLQEAQELYSAGLIEDIPGMLEMCMKNGFTRDEKEQAHKLIILSYLFDDDIEAADRAMLEFLKDFPDYQVVATDPREFVTLLESYDRNPVLMIGGGVGTNITFPMAIATVGTHNYSDHHGNYTPGAAGFHASVRLEKRLKSKLDLVGEIEYSYNQFSFNLDPASGKSTFTGEITSFSRISYHETQNRIAIPVSISYLLGEGKLTPSLRAGLAPGLLFSATGDGLREYDNTGNIRLEPVSVTGIDVLPARRIFNAWAFVGGGASYGIGPGVLSVDARFYFNLLNQVGPNSDRFNQNLAFETMYVSDDLLLNNLSITVGYVLPVFNPQKRDD